MVRKSLEQPERLHEVVANGVLSHNHWTKFIHCLHQLALAKLIQQKALAKRSRKGSIKLKNGFFSALLSILLLPIFN